MQSDCTAICKHLTVNLYCNTVVDDQSFHHALLRRNFYSCKELGGIFLIHGHAYQERNSDDVDGLEHI